LNARKEFGDNPFCVQSFLDILKNTHTKYKSDRFDTTLDISEQRTFSFLEDIKKEKYVTKQFYKHYSFISRLKDKFSMMSWKINK